MLSHLALFVTGRVNYGIGTCTYSVQVGTAITLHMYCISLGLFLSCLCVFLSRQKSWRPASIADGCGPVVDVPFGDAGSFVISSMSSGQSSGLSIGLASLVAYGLWS